MRADNEITSEQAVILFTKAPMPGKTKTRMMPYLSASECAELQSCFLKDIAKEIRKSGADLYVSYESSGGLGELEEICGDAVYFPQAGDELGSRMHNAIEAVLKKGYSSCLLVGSDIPEIRAKDLKRAFLKLDGSDVVAGPSVDGGYWLIGMHRPFMALFSDRKFSHDKVLEELLQTAEEKGIKVSFCATHRDMDIPEDLKGYLERMRKDPHLRLSNTGKFLTEKMTVSVIVPVYNEISTIDSMVSQLEKLKDQAEIIIADGGSTDDTVSRIPKDLKLIHTPKGRAVQMNAGAREAKGDILFFAHCDSELPEDAIDEIRKAMTKGEAGCFGIAFHSRQFFMWTCRVISNHRASRRRIMFGDQGIFMTRELFEAVGGFPEIPIMEDYQLSLTLKERGVRPVLCSRRIYTSDRRFPKKNIPKLKVMWKMNRLRKAYREGVPIEDIAAQYKDIR